MRSYDLLVFDWDGTLYDSIDWIVLCLQQAAQCCAVAPPNAAAARAVIGLGLAEALATLFPHADARQRNQFVEAYRALYVHREVHPEQMYAGVYETLTELRDRGYRLAVATGKGRAGLDRALRGTATGHLFAASRCADETASKPHPQMLLELMEELQATPERTLMIGDSIHDLKMAVRAGVASAAVANGAWPRAQLLEQRPAVCLESVAELSAYLA